MTTGADPGDHDEDRRRSARRALLALAVALLPAVAAVWVVPVFVTQDGPAHLYNAHVLVEALGRGDDSPFAGVYEPRWRPMPNWGAPLLLMGLVATVPPMVAERAMTTLTLVGLAGSVLWLRWRVAGTRGLTVGTVLAALIGLNVAWLFGFSSFLVGLTLLPVAWGLWWSRRDRPGPALAAGLGALLVLGYLGHLVGLALTVAGLGVLCLATPGPWALRGRRVVWTAAACLPLVPMAIAYKAMTAEGGAFAPSWEAYGSPLSPSYWAKRLAWIDPLTLGRRDVAPFMVDLRSRWCVALVPSLWVGLALCVDLGDSIRRGPSAERRPWLILAGLLGLGALVGPDGFGEDHGYYLSQRVALVGLIALAPGLDLDTSRRSGRLIAGLLGVALTLQSAFVWDYGLESDRRAGSIVRLVDEAGRGRRIGTLLVDIAGRYRANPLLHADCLLGVGTGNVVWSNYEVRHYYFPVRVRPGLDAPPSVDFEEVAVLGGDERADRWRRLLDRHGRAIDTLIVWGADPVLDAINARHFPTEPAAHKGPIRLYRRTQGAHPR